MAELAPGAHTFGFVWSCDAAEAVARLAAVGVRQFQLMGMAPHLDPWTPDPARLAQLRATVAACGGEVLAIDLPSSDSNLASLSPRTVDASVALYTQALEVGAAVGARWLTINSGRSHALLPPPDDRLRDVFRGALVRLVAAAEARGMRILIENIPGMVLPDARSLRTFLDQDDHGLVDVLYDVANAAAIGEDPVAGIETLGERIRVLHLSDAPRGAWRHDPIGSGGIDFPAILRTARRLRYDGAVVLEIIGADPLAAFCESRARILALSVTPPASPRPIAARSNPHAAA